ncbi:MAG: hypothetical protein PHC85_02440 [Candidatus Pacebacteria bacterium]|nr:hypothetical protein [Candidatus Paceibacterota bacterium]
MIGLMAAAAAAGLATFLLCFLLERIARKRDKERQKEDRAWSEAEKQAGEEAEAKRQAEEKKEAERAEAERRARGEEERRKNVERLNREQRRNELLERIVRETEFSLGETEVLSDSTDPEAVSRPSIVPTGFIDIRPVQSMEEIRNILPVQQLMDDESFYASLAAHQLLVLQPMEFTVKAKKVLVLLVDRSDSMKELGRVFWAIALVEKMADKCLDAGACLILKVFTEFIESVAKAETPEQFAELKRQLPHLLSPDGGTNIQVALKSAIGELSSSKISEKKILLATDGDCPIDENDLLLSLKENNISLRTVCISGEHAGLMRISEFYDVLWDH